MLRKQLRVSSLLGAALAEVSATGAEADAEAAGAGSGSGSATSETAALGLAAPSNIGSKR